MMNDTFDPIISDEEYTSWVHISAATSQRQRSDGSGPPFIQLSERRIGYRKSAVERWLEARTINRVGALIAAKQVPGPAARATVTATVMPETSKVESPPPSTRERRGLEQRRRPNPGSIAATATVAPVERGDIGTVESGARTGGAA